MSSSRLRVETQKGFTLIEMSIVLVIIGLIIGGILKGQEIIESARQKNVISQFDALRGAVNTFVDRYGSLPGDFALATTRINTNAVYANGNGNGIIGTAATTVATIATNDGSAGASENLQFWVHLAGAQLVEGVLASNTTPTAFGTNGALPSTSISGSGLSVVSGNYPHATAARNTVWARLHRVIAAPVAALSPMNAYQIDNKVDDGVSGVGTFRTDQAASCGTADAVTQDYAFDNRNVLCIGIIDIIQ